MAALDAALDYVRAHHDAYLEQLKSLVAIPSVSTSREMRPRSFSMLSCR